MKIKKHWLGIRNSKYGIFLLLCGIPVLSAQAATITWDAPADITDSGNDVIHNGGRFAAELMVGSATDIEGTTFRARGGSGVISYSSGNTYAGDSICPNSSNPDVADAYRTMLRSVSWQSGGGVYSITLTNLTPGTTYKIQIWSSSADSIAAGSTVTWMDAVSGGNQVTLDVQKGDVEGNLGQYVVGSFIADSTGSQVIYGVGNDAFLNGIQVRDLSLPDGWGESDSIPENPVTGPSAVEWDEAHNIVDDSDIATKGVLLAAENVGSSASSIINGVAFGGWNTSGHLEYSSTLNYTGVGAPGVSDEYFALLNGISWDESDQYTISVNGLLPGDSYLLQVWFSSQLNTPSDERVFVVDRTTGITNSVVLNSNAGNGLGQYGLGRFVSTSTNLVVGIEKKSLGASGSPAFNGIQVRKLSHSGMVSVDVSTQGSGTVSVVSGEYSVATNLSFTATPDAGWLFIGWSGDLEGDYTIASTNLRMFCDYTITANFSLDADNDGLNNSNEVVLGTDPRNSDSDGDGLSDGDEVNTYSTDPLVVDTDEDGLSDGDEVNVYGTNPLLSDSDGDGLSDNDELNVYNTNPVLLDSDSDGLSDGEELNTYQTDPLNSDSDGDGASDGSEVNLYSTNPTEAESGIDRDGDGIIDTWEGEFFGDIANCEPSDDPDGDLYTNLEEYKNSTDPTVFDTYLMHQQAVELIWKAVDGVSYQVQATTNLASGEWFDVGEPIVGDGSVNSILESTRQDDSRIYRLQILK